MVTGVIKRRRWCEVMFTEALVAGTVAVTGTVCTFFGKQWGTSAERHSQAIQLLNEVKQLRNEEADARRKAEEGEAKEIERRRIAEDNYKRVCDELGQVKLQVENMAREITSLRDQVRDHNELQDLYDNAIVEIDNLESEMEALTKKYMDSELEKDKLQEERDKYRELWTDHCKRKLADETDGMDPSGVPLE